MTSPLDDNSLENVATLIGDGAQAVADNAQRLGLTWILRLATVATGADASSVKATFDTDTVAIPMVSMIGALSKGQRVYVMIVPPAGNFIVGMATDLPQGLGIIDANTGNAISTSTLGAETAVPSGSWLTEPFYRLKNSRIFKADLSAQVTGNTLNSVAQYRVRKGSASVSGTSLCIWRHQTASVFVADVASYFGYFKNDSGADINTQLSLTVALVGGAGTVFVIGDTTVPIILAIEDVGGIESNVNLAAMIPSV